MVLFTQEAEGGLELLGPTSVGSGTSSSLRMRQERDLPVPPRTVK